MQESGKAQAEGERYVRRTAENAGGGGGADPVGLHFAHYNFVRIHKTLRVTPAMAAGVSNRLWSIEDLIAAPANSD